MWPAAAGLHTEVACRRPATYNPAAECSAREPGEEVENLLVPVAEALEMVRDGRITDSKTVAALLYWERFKRGVD